MCFLTCSAAEGDRGSVALPDDLQTEAAVVQTRDVLHQHEQQISGHVVRHVLQNHTGTLNGL